ncbi:MAG: hypothetical protein ACRDPW_01580 [Mycobacteriales bacterium]
MAQRSKQRAQQEAKRRRKALAEKPEAANVSALPEPAAQIDPVMHDGAEKDGAEEPDYERTDDVAKFWDESEIELVEIALPGAGSGSRVGYTLRHYRPAMFYPEPEPEPEAEPDEFDDEPELPETVQVPDESRDDKDDTTGNHNNTDAPEPDPADFESDDEPVGEEREEVVMLAHEGMLHVFGTARALVEFVTSDAPHDLAEVEAFIRLKETLTPQMVAPSDEDRYELDLVVRNLRGGRDAWDAELLISAAEIARDITYACGLREALAALGPGSPLDTLDDALRDGGFWARRRIGRLKPEQVALAWRGVIGKIAGATKWHG